MKKNFINEASRLQKLAGIKSINESFTSKKYLEQAIKNLLQIATNMIEDKGREEGLNSSSRVGLRIDEEYAIAGRGIKSEQGDMEYMSFGEAKDSFLVEYKEYLETVTEDLEDEEVEEWEENEEFYEVVVQGNEEIKVWWEDWVDMSVDKNVDPEEIPVMSIQHMDLSGEGGPRYYVFNI